MAKDIVIFAVLNFLLCGMTVTAIIRTDDAFVSIAAGFMGVFLVLLINFMICVGKSSCSIRGYYDFFFK